MRAGCVICGDVFMPNIEVSATPCGHVFHTICVSQWFERSKTCPQCRDKCRQKLIRLYFDEGEAEVEQDSETLKCHLDNAKFQLKLKDQELHNLKNEFQQMKSINEGLREEIVQRNDKEKTQATLICTLESQLRFLSGLKEKSEKMKEERDRAISKLRSMQDLQLLLSGTEGEVEQTLADYGNCNSEVARNLANVCVMLKREINAENVKKNSYRTELQQLKEEHKRRQQQFMALKLVESSLQQKVACQANDIHRLEEENLSVTRKLTALREAIDSPSGDVARGLVRRLLQENCTPQGLKRSLSATAAGDSQASSGGASGEQEDGFICTPEVLRKNPRLLSQQDRSSSSSQQASCVLDDSQDLFADEEEEELQCGQGGVGGEEAAAEGDTTTDLLLAQYQLNMTVPGTSPDTGGSSPYLKVKSTSVKPPNRQVFNRPPTHTIFGKKAASGSGAPLLSSQSSKKSASVVSSKGYDGLGGRSGADDFPRPRPVLIKKRQVANHSQQQQKTTTKIRVAGNSSAGVQTLTNFFKNPFDD